MNRPSFHREVPAAVRVAQLVGLTTAAFYAGQTASTTYLSIPALLQAPAPLLARQWKTQWLRAKAFAPALSLGLTALFGWFAWRERSSNPSAFRFYTAASLLFPSVIPWTFFVMRPYNTKLLQKVDEFESVDLDSQGYDHTPTKSSNAEAGTADKETVHMLVDRWATLNLVRAGITAVAALMATWATLSSVEV